MAAVITWVLSVVFAGAGELPGLADLPDATARVRKMLAESPGSFRLVLYGATAVFIAGPILTVGWPLPAFLLPAAKRDAHAYRMSVHRAYLVRQAMLMLKTVGGLVWGGHPDVRAALALPAYSDDPGTFRAGGESWQNLQNAGKPGE